MNAIFTCFSDYSKGFGGKYGVQKEAMDKAAVGWDHQEKAAQHESQKGESVLFYINPLYLDGFSHTY